MTSLQPDLRRQPLQRMRPPGAAILALAASITAGEPYRDPLHSLASWRSWNDFQGWHAAKGLELDTRAESRIVSAKSFMDREGSVNVRLVPPAGRWSRVEMWFRCTSDLRNGYVIAFEPTRRRLLIEKLCEGRAGQLVVAETDGEAALLGLGYRVEGNHIVATLNGKDTVEATDPELIQEGHLALGGAFVKAVFSDLAVAYVGHAGMRMDTFESLQGWRTSYGPSAWTVTRDASTNGAQNRVACFDAQADGAVLGGEEWANFVAEVKGKFLDASRHWACFGLRPKVCDGERSLYVIEVRGKQNVIVLWKSVHGARDAALTRTVPIPPIEEGKWYTLRVRFEGDRITAELNGTRYLDLVDAQPIHRGRVAISASHASVHIDDFRQERLESDYQFPTEEAKPEPHDAGPSLPPALARGDEDGHYWYLANRGLRTAIHKRTGMFGGLWDAANGRRIIDRMYHLYHFETRDAEQRTNGHGDVVTSLSKETAQEVEVVCKNDDLPHVRIVKRYVLTPDSNQLLQTIRFLYRGTRPDVFVTTALAGVVDDAFREEAIYTGGSYLGPLVRASTIRTRTLTDSFKKPWVTGTTNGRPSWILALNHGLDQSYALFRYRVNGQYVLPWNSIWTELLNNLYHTPVGWEMGLCTLHLEPGQERSAEVRHTTFRGGRFAFYEWYRQLPDVRAMHDAVGRRPSWVSDIKMWNTAGSPASLDMSEEGTLVRIMHPFGVWGDLPTSGAATSASGIVKRPVEMIREQIRDAQRSSPRLKAGFYTWAWSAHRFSDIYRDRPDWFIRCDKAGQERNAYPLPMSYVRSLTAPGCFEGTLRQYRELVRYYGEDLQYLDNDGTGVQVIDWQHLRVDQDYHWQRCHEGILAAARARSPECATFFNNRVLPQGDISFAEFRESEIHGAEWRESANAMYPLKVFQKRDRGRALILLYWRAATEPSYINYCVGLGITPWANSIARLPFVNAAFETRHLEVMDAGLSPDWEQDFQTDVEAYTLRQGEAAIVTLFGHDECPEAVPVAFDTEAMGLRPGEPACAWLFELKDSRTFRGRLTEKECREAYEAHHWGEDLVVQGEFLGRIPSLPERYQRTVTACPLRLRMLMLTHSPAIVWSVNGRRNHFWWPTVRRVSVSGTLDVERGRTVLKCVSEADRAELLIYVPEHAVPLSLRIDGKRASTALERISNNWFIRVGVPQGTHEIVTRYERAEEVALTSLELSAPEQVEAGSSLPVVLRCGSVKLPGRDALVSVWHSGTLVASVQTKLNSSASAQLTIPVPASARPGIHDLAVSVPGAKPPSQDEIVSRFVVEKGEWQPTIKPGHERGRPVVKVWGVGKTINGLEVLRAGTDTWDHRGSVQQAEWDLAKLTAKCGIKDFAHTHWGYGFCGLEVRGAKAIVADAKNTFSVPYQRGFDLGNRYLDSFVGFIIDYHTPQGYTKRVALSIGIDNKQRPVCNPNWGKASSPDDCIELSKTILGKPRDTIMIELTKYAPSDWDGTAWVAVGVDTVRRGLKLEARLAKGLLP